MHSQCCWGPQKSAVWLNLFVFSFVEVLQYVSGNWKRKSEAMQGQGCGSGL